MHVSKGGWNFRLQSSESSTSLSNQDHCNCPPYVALWSLSNLFPNLPVAWARDEPPSPDDQHEFLPVPSHESLHRPSDVASFQSSDPRPSRWWTFALPRPQRTNTLDKEVLSEVKQDLRGNPVMDRSNHRRSGSGDNATLKDSEPRGNGPSSWGLRVDLPLSPPKPFTLSHTQSPGWDTPWSARHPLSAIRTNGNGDAYNESTMEDHQPKGDDDQNPWKQRKKVLRNFLLTNGYVPLVSVPVSAFRMSKV